MRDTGSVHVQNSASKPNQCPCAVCLFKCKFGARPCFLICCYHNTYIVYMRFLQTDM